MIENEPIRELVRRSVTSKPGEGLADILSRSGWSRAPGGTQKRELWSNGALKGSLRLSGPVPYFTVTLEVHDPTEEEDLDFLVDQFESKFEEVMAMVAEGLGAADSESRGEEPGVIVPGEFIRAASWNRGARCIVIGFQHEDAEVPLRVSLYIAATGDE